MLWKTILKAKKLNIESIRNILDYFLEEINPTQLAMSSLHDMVVSTYRKYNFTMRAIAIKSILSQMLLNRGFTKLNTSSAAIIAYDDLLGKKIKGTFYRKLKND